VSNPVRRYVYVIGPDGDQLKVLLTTVEAALPDDLNVKSWIRDTNVGTISVTLVERLSDAAAVVADLREANPNVYYEIGLAHAFGTPVILVADDATDARFDLQHERVLKIRRANGEARVEGLESELRKSIEEVLATPPTTAVEFARLRRALAEGAPTLTSSRSMSKRDNGAGPSWRDLALAGALLTVRSEHVENRLRVFHLDYGLGRVVGYSPIHLEPLSLTIDFEDGGRTLMPLPVAGLFLASVRAIGES
jgi:hypothetical protein